MKNHLLLIMLIVFFTFGYSTIMSHFGNDFLNADGIDRRILRTKTYLSGILTQKELNALDFKGAVVHIKDSINFFIKIPYTKKNYPGFYLVKSSEKVFQYVQVRIKNYHYKDSVMLDLKKEVVIDSRIPSLKKAFTINFRGLVEKITYPGYNMNKRDTMLGIIPFMIYDAAPGEHKSYIDANFIFDPITSLNKEVLTKGIITHDMIPLGFTNAKSFELEYSNSGILPAIDIKNMFGAFDTKVDSVKKQ